NARLQANVRDRSAPSRSFRNCPRWVCSLTAESGGARGSHDPRKPRAGNRCALLVHGLPNGAGGAAAEVVDHGLDPAWLVGEKEQQAADGSALIPLPLGSLERPSRNWILGKTFPTSPSTAQPPQRRNRLAGLRPRGVVGIGVRIANDPPTVDHEPRRDRQRP